jgi:NitT/TauT family transport system ATP-binding protein
MDFLVTGESFSYQQSSSTFTLRLECFGLSRGQIVCLHGRSGCGKTTLMNLLAGVIDTPLGKRCRQCFPTISYVMHETTLLPWLSVQENFRVETRLRERKADFEGFQNLCRKLALDPGSVNLKPSKLSLGMRQRVEIAKALSFGSDLILLDEAFSGLDPKAKQLAMYVICEAVAKKGIAVVATAHHYNDLIRLAQRIYMIEEGRVGPVIDVNEPVEDRLAMSHEQLLSLGEKHSVPIE